MRLRTALCACIAAFFCVACGGGDNSGAYPVSNPPSGPGNDGGNNPPPPPTYTIGGAVTGLQGTGLVLQNADSHLPVAGNGSFAFSDLLTGGTSYSVSVQTQPANPTQVCTVANGSGTVETANVINITVTCETPEANRSWRTPMQLHQDDADAEESGRLAINAHGTAVLIWRQNVSDVVQIEASRYTPESKQWSTPTLLGPQGGTENLSAEAVPQVAITESGDAVAVWPRLVNGTYQMWGCAYTDSGGWGAPVRIDTATAGATDSRVIYDSIGGAMVIWQQLDGARRHIDYSRRAAGATTWSAPAQLDTTVGEAAPYPQLAADAHGNLVAVWVQTDSAQTGSVYHVWSSVYRSNMSSWSVPEVIGNDPTFSALLPNVVSDAAGTAEAIWTQTDNSIWSNQYTPASGWGTAKLLEAGGNGNNPPQLAIDQNGNVLAVWSRSDPNDPQSHMRYAALPAGGSDWTASALLSATDASADENVESPQIGSNSQGDMLAMWSHISGGHLNVRSAVYTPGSGWSTPVDVGNTSDAIDPVLVVAPSGNVVAAWQQRVDNVSTLWATFLE